MDAATSTRAELPQRLLRLLTLLLVRRTWTAAELTDRLGGSARTLRRDVERLRSLDYRVEGTPGVAGGYRLVSGSELPHVPLEEREAVAITLGLATVTGIGDSALSALAKLERLLPARLRGRLLAVGDSSSAVDHPGTVPTDPLVLGTLAGACRDRAVVDLTYRDRTGTPTERRVEPHHLVEHGGHWYLLAHDTGRGDWRTFRVDRARDPRTTHRRFGPRELPAPDPASFLTDRLARGAYRHTATLTVRIPAHTLLERLFHRPPGRVRALDEHRCEVRVSADDLDLLCRHISVVAALGEPLTCEAPPEAVERMRGTADVLTAAFAGSGGGGRFPAAHTPPMP